MVKCFRLSNKCSNALWQVDLHKKLPKITLSFTVTMGHRMLVTYITMGLWNVDVFLGQYETAGHLVFMCTQHKIIQKGQVVTKDERTNWLHTLESACFWTKHVICDWLIFFFFGQFWQPDQWPKKKKKKRSQISLRAVKKKHLLKWSRSSV